MEIPDDKFLILVVLFLDISNTVVRNFIALVSSDKQAAAIGTVVVFAISSACVVITAHFTVLSFQLGVATVSYWFLQSVAVVAYFYGDNINYIFDNYGEELGCGQKCSENNRIAAVVLLGSAMLILNIFPILYHNLVEMKKCGDFKRGKWYYTLDMVAMLARIDVIFTTISEMAQTDNFCSREDRSLGWSMFCVCSLVGIAGIAINGAYSVFKINGESTEEESTRDNKDLHITVVAVIVLLSIALLLYILSDNEQPLDCEWKCDSRVREEMMSRVDCNVKGSSGVKFCLMTIALLLIIASLLTMLGCRKRVENRVV